MVWKYIYETVLSAHTGLYHGFGKEGRNIVSAKLLFNAQDRVWYVKRRSRKAADLYTETNLAARHSVIVK